MTSYTKFAVKGAATVFVVSILAAFAGYLVRLVLARNLRVEDFGLFYAVFAFLGFFGMFKTFGIDKALAKFIPEFRHNNNKTFIKSSIIYAAFTQLLTNSVIIIAVYLLSGYLSTSFFHYSQAAMVLRLMAIALFLDSFTQVLKFAFQGFKEMLWYSAIDVVRMSLILGIILIGFKLNYGVLSPIIAYILAPAILTIIFGWIFVKNVFPQFFESRFVIDRRLLKNLSGYGIFVVATIIGMDILGYTDTIVLTYFTGLTNVALYNVALPTAKLLLYFPRSISSVLLPLTSEFWVKKKEKLLIAGIESLYKYSLIIVVPAVFVMLSFSELLINIFFGESYTPASNALKILSIGMLFTALSTTCSNFFSGIGKPQINSQIIYSAALFNLITNLILIPRWGIIGAAITTTATYFIMMVMGLSKIRKFIKVQFPVKIWAKTLTSGFILIIVIWISKKVLLLSLWLETAVILVVSGLVYVALLFLLKIINPEELKGLYKRIVG
ncbi:flippase [Candidatus Woesearchaeota archaeon]|nr:flippase [Candidatus Woesearchaeota archaeon]